MEAIWSIAVLALASTFLGRMPFRGARFLTVCALYAVGRLGLEFLREPEPGSAPFRLGHACSLVLVFSAAAILVIGWPR